MYVHENIFLLDLSFTFLHYPPNLVDSGHVRISQPQRGTSPLDVAKSYAEK